MKETGSKSAFDLDALHVQLANLRSEIEDLADTLATGFGQARAGAKEAVGEGKEFVGRMQNLGRDRVHAADQTLEHAARERPLTTVLVAAAIGFLIGALLRR